MAKTTNNPSSLRKAERVLRQHWLIALCVAGFVGILWISAPAWAAPVQQGGTVPLPTPTSETEDLATATPQPDDSSDNSGSTDSSNGSTETTDPANPNVVFGPGGGAGGAVTSTLTARVTVDGLNLREGAGTTFNALGNLPANTVVTVLSRNEDGTWWYICCLANSQTNGWVSAQLLAPDFDIAQANDLIPVFGTTPTPVPATPAPAQASQSSPQAGQPLGVDFMIYPYFVWQGITATLTITVNNSNTVDAVDAVLSDELPASLTLISAEADAAGTVETVNTADGRPLLLFRWATIPADTAVSATIVVQVAPTIGAGEVIDNLVATRARNVPYAASAVTIGMPPVVPPDFQ